MLYRWASGISIPFRTTALACILFLGVSAIASESEHPSTDAERAAFAANLQGFLNSTDVVGVNVVAEGPNFTVLRIVRPGAFRSQFGSLIRPFMPDLSRLGFKSLILCTIRSICRQIFVPVGTDAAF